jgi:hypothetical protein
LILSPGSGEKGGDKVKDFAWVIEFGGQPYSKKGKRQPSNWQPYAMYDSQSMARMMMSYLTNPFMYRVRKYVRAK